MPDLPAPVSHTHGVSLPPRYTIRPIDSVLAPWAKALMIHGFLLRPSSIWEPLLPEPKAANALRAFSALDGHFSHAIRSGHSYAVVDAEYAFRRPGSAETGGRLYWDELDPGDPDFAAQGGRLMYEGMDFPLVCVGLAVDAMDKKPDQATRDLYALMPLVRELGTWLSAREEHDSSGPPAVWGESLVRSGCVTRQGYVGRGLMTALNRFMLLEARARGYRAVRAGVANGSVYRCWMRPPGGCRSSVAASFRLRDIELEDEDGALVRPYVGSQVNEYGWLVRCEFTSSD